jgi:hypothetical protein
LAGLFESRPVELEEREDQRPVRQWPPAQSPIDAAAAPPVLPTTLIFSVVAGRSVVRRALARTVIG